MTDSESPGSIAGIKGADQLADRSRLQMCLNEGHLGGYILNGAAPGTWCPGVWDWAIDELGVTSVLDVGCGLGHAANYFGNRGVKILGVEGSPSAIRDSVIKRNVANHDFTVGPYIPPCAFDMVWSAEFVEHVDERYSGNFLVTFGSARRFIMLTYAEPGQGGHHHVNEQPLDYWTVRLRQLGFELNQDLTEKSRKLIGDHPMVGKHFRNRGLVFCRHNQTLST